MPVKKRIYGIFFFYLLFCFFNQAHAQQDVVLFQYKTPKNSLPVTGYYQIQGYRVKGNPYYKPEFILGDMYSVVETAKNIYLRFDVYYQNVEFISSANKDQILVKEPAELDSFLIYKKENKIIKEDIRFVYATIIGAPGNYYYSCVFKGEKYSVYKRYVAELVAPIDKTGRPDTREFEIQAEYWYVTESTKEFKKLNSTVAAVKKEFKDIKDLSEILKAGNMFKNVDAAMVKVFTYLNE